MTDGTAAHPLVFWVTAPERCPYLPDRLARRVVTVISHEQGRANHDLLARAGFRRNQTVCYQPVCQDCVECQPIRVRADEFRWTRSLRRIWRRNHDLVASWNLPEATSEQFALFRRYQFSRHDGGDMGQMDFAEYAQMIEHTPIRTGILEFRHGQAGVLLGVMLIDVQDDGLSAVYSFFCDRSPARSLGIYMILDLIDRAASSGLPYAYLGYWIRNSPKMAYKSRFGPSEVYRGGVWMPLQPGSPPRQASRPVEVDHRLNG